MENVIDMLNGIISSDKSASPDKTKTETKPEEEKSKSDDSSPERLKTKAIESMSRKHKDSERSIRSDE